MVCSCRGIGIVGLVWCWSLLDREWENIMAFKKRCIVTDGELPNRLEYVRGLSISIGKIPMIIYSCKGDKIHPPHLVRVDNGKNIATRKQKGIKTRNKGLVIEPEHRKRLFSRDLEAHCIVGKVKLTFRKRETKKFNDETVDIYWCRGRTGSHSSHLVRVSHGMIPNTKLGLLIFTLEI